MLKSMKDEVTRYKHGDKWSYGQALDEIHFIDKLQAYYARKNSP